MTPLTRVKAPENDQHSHHNRNQFAVGTEITQRNLTREPCMLLCTNIHINQYTYISEQSRIRGMHTGVFIRALKHTHT